MSNLVQIYQPPKFNDYPKWWLYKSAAYLGGLGLTFGDQIVPHLAKQPDKSSVTIDLKLTSTTDVFDERLSLFADSKADHVFVGPRLMEIANQEGMFRNLVKKLAVGGHLILGQYTDKVSPEHFNAIIAALGRWKNKATYVRDGSFVSIYKRLEGKRGIEPATTITPKGRACIARYGALGDMIIITPLIHQLHADGFTVTMNVSPYCLPIIQNNPFVSNLVIQEREMIPNPELGQYWKEWEGEYERYINLSESLEGRFLKVEGRRDFFTTKEWRIKTGEHNYYDATMRLGGYPERTGTKGELYFTNAEERNGQRNFNQYKGKFVIVWAMNGSSFHKIYPAMEAVVAQWLEDHDDSVIITVGDGAAKQTGYEHPRLVNMCGKWSIRESLFAAKQANLVIGPETMMTNAAGSLGTPTITLLSHSTHEALCKHWGANDYCLAPENIACYPCFQLHYSRESCPNSQAVDKFTGEVLSESPSCTFGVSPERLIARIQEVYSKQVINNFNIDMV